MPYVAEKRLTWGGGFIEKGEPVPENEPGRRYDLMVRAGQIKLGDAAQQAEQAPIPQISDNPNVPEALGMDPTTLQKVGDSGGAPPHIDPASSTKKELFAWLTQITGKEPGPATKEETLRARVIELLAAPGTTSSTNPSDEEV